MLIGFGVYMLHNFDLFSLKQFLEFFEEPMMCRVRRLEFLMFPLGFNDSILLVFLIKITRLHENHTVYSGRISNSCKTAGATAGRCWFVM